MSWYKNVVSNAPEDTRFSSAQVGDYRVTLARNADGRFGLAVCSPNDAFNRKQGQAIAYARLQSKSTSLGGYITNPPGKGGGEDAIFAAQLVAANAPDRFPSAFLIALEDEAAKLAERTSTVKGE